MKIKLTAQVNGMWEKQAAAQRIATEKQNQ